MDGLCVACKAGDLDTVKKLVGGGAGANGTGGAGAPLHAVSPNGHLTLVQWLVSQGAAVGAIGNGGMQPPPVRVGVGIYSRGSTGYPV